MSGYNEGMATAKSQDADWLVMLKLMYNRTTLITMKPLPILVRLLHGRRLVVDVDFAFAAAGNYGTVPLISNCLVNSSIVLLSMLLH